MTPSFGVKLPGLVPTYARTLREIPDLAHAFERMGFDDVMDGEHILFGPVMDHPGGSGNFEHSRTTSQSDRCDSMLMFAAIAACFGKWSHDRRRHCRPSSTRPRSMMWVSYRNFSGSECGALSQ